MYIATPDGCQPIEDLDSRRDGDDHGGKDEEGIACRAKADSEHMMCPHTETDEADRDRGRNHRRITKDGLAGEDGDDLVDERERWQHQNVDLRVAEDPEVVHPQNG